MLNQVIGLVVLCVGRIQYYNKHSLDDSDVIEPLHERYQWSRLVDTGYCNAIRKVGRQTTQYDYENEDPRRTLCA